MARPSPWRSRTLGLILALALGLGACGDPSGRRAVGSVCDAPSQCESGLCSAQLCIDPFSCVDALAAQSDASFVAACVAGLGDLALTPSSARVDPDGSVQLTLSGSLGSSGSASGASEVAPQGQPPAAAAALTAPIDLTRAARFETDPPNRAVFDAAVPGLARVGEGLGSFTVRARIGPTADERVALATVVVWPLVCGERECGALAGTACGACDVLAGEVCSAQGRCVAPAGDLGAYCGVTGTCTPTSPGWPGCLDEQCASKSCLTNSAVVYVPKEICTQGCTIHKDTDADGVNDRDAPFEDCATEVVVEGPTGNWFRCVNSAAVDGNPVGVCLPGTEFSTCTSDLDCPAGEGCELVAGGRVTFRCLTKTQAGAWGGVAAVGQPCNGDPAVGPVALCETGICVGAGDGVSAGSGCLVRCGEGTGEPTDAERAICDTTKTVAGTGCISQSQTCAGRPERACAADVDCSSWECVPGVLVELPPEVRFCVPAGCTSDADCGGGFNCDTTVASPVCVPASR